ncbi:hypothetical protein ANN_18193 [Periplaneta americana]|uniref:Uncharacterized protein n=1 Tax=Periplaneta americana TaxID=6978 RepID=A0ABQ8SPJ2_PERAM|nr:hypothetical protein ANN_18193 [Periplaneta americana]
MQTRFSNTDEPLGTVDKVTECIGPSTHVGDIQPIPFFHDCSKVRKKLTSVRVSKQFTFLPLQVPYVSQVYVILTYLPLRFGERETRLPRSEGARALVERCLCSTQFSSSDCINHCHRQVQYDYLVLTVAGDVRMGQIKTTIYKKPCLNESQLLTNCLVSLRLNSILFRQSLMLAGYLVYQEYELETTRHKKLVTETIRQIIKIRNSVQLATCCGSKKVFQHVQIWSDRTVTSAKTEAHTDYSQLPRNKH